jgi:hypothetical protein
MNALSPSISSCTCTIIESAIAYALDGILTPGMRKHAGIDLAWGVDGDDLASSIAAVSLPDDNTLDESAFPPWPVRTER